MVTLDKKTSMLTILAIVISIIGGIYLAAEDSHEHTNVKPLYGREKEQNQLLTEVLGKHRVIEIVGIPGIGKTSLIQNTTETLTKVHGYCIVYVMVSAHKNIESVMNHLANERKCMSGFGSIILTINKTFNNENPSDGFLQPWYESLKSKTVIILDDIDVDKMMDDLEQNVIRLLQTASSTTKIVRISRFTKVKNLRRPVIKLEGINSSICATWISSTYTQIVYETGVQLCDVLNGVPFEVESIASYVTHPLTSGSIDDVIDELNNTDYGKPFKYLEDLWNNYEDTSQQTKAVYLLYDRLASEYRTCIWLLVEMTSDLFTKYDAEQHLQNTNISTEGCLDTLLMHSLLEVVTFAPKKLFKLTSYVKMFIESLGEPQHDSKRTSIQARHFYGNYVENNAGRHHLKLEREGDLQLAINIGSNRQLINTFLSLLGGQYELKPLFKMALIVIEDHYCMPNEIQKSSNAKTLLAFSYLTKALHCPKIHPPSMILSSKPKLQPKTTSCFHKLINCPEVQSIERDDYESAEALGYYNSLLIYAMNKSASWQLFLTDISFMVTLADHECIQYCWRISYCTCGKKTSLEHGLRLFLVRNYALSTRYFQSTLYQTSSTPCQNILRIIAIAGVYASTSTGVTKDAIHHQLESINFHDLNLSCFLGVMYDLIVPFLSEINYNESQILKVRLNSTIKREEEICNKEAKTNEDRLDCGPKFRYTVAHGVTALKMIELQDDLKWPQEVTEYSSREEWVCSIIRDKTTKCKEDLPLFSQVRSIETQQNYERLWVMKYFMDEAEFEQLYKRAESIPRFYQLMSI